MLGAELDRPGGILRKPRLRALSSTAASAFVRPDLRDRPHPDRDIDDLPAAAIFGRASRQAFSAVAGFGKNADDLVRIL